MVILVDSSMPNCSPPGQRIGVALEWSTLQHWNIFKQRCCATNTILQRIAHNFDSSVICIHRLHQSFILSSSSSLSIFSDSVSKGFYCRFFLKNDHSGLKLSSVIFLMDLNLPIILWYRININFLCTKVCTFTLYLFCVIVVELWMWSY